MCISESSADSASVVITDSRIFGTQTTPPAPILKVLPKIFAHTDKVVRAEGSLLVQTFYQYIGPAVEPWLADLKPVQVKELKEAFDAMEKEGKGKGSLKPERLTRLQAREVEAVADQGEGGVVGDLDEDGEYAKHAVLLFYRIISSKISHPPIHEKQLSRLTLSPSYPTIFRPTSLRPSGRNERRSLMTLPLSSPPPRV